MTGMMLSGPTIAVSENASLIVSWTDSYYEPPQEYYECLEEAADRGAKAIHFTDQYCDGRHEWCSEKIPWHHGRRNASLATNDEAIAKEVQIWAEGQNRFETQKCADDLRDGEFKTMAPRLEVIATDQIACQVFPAEMEQ